MEEQLRERLRDLEKLEFVKPAQAWSERKTQIRSKFAEFKSVFTNEITDPDILAQLNEMEQKLK